MNNVFVQCELWCEEILRRVARPCCTCSRHVSSQALDDLVPLGPRMHFKPGASSAFVPGLQVAVVPCPSKSSVRGSPPPVCPGMPEPGSCSNLKGFTHSYFVHGVQQSSPFMRSNNACPACAFTCLSQTATILSSPDQLENRFKSRVEKRHNPSLKDDTHVTSSSNILQTPTATSSSTWGTFSHSNDGSKKPILLQTLPHESVHRDVGADSDIHTGVQKVRYGRSLDDVINPGCVLQKPSSLFSTSRK